MLRNRGLFAVLLAALLVASGATLGGAAIGQSTTPADATNSAQTTPTNVSSETDGWPAPRADAGRTGATSDDGPLPHANTSWTAAATGGHTWDPVVTDDTVVMAYAGDEYPNGLVEAYNASTGEVRWEQTNVGEPTGPASTEDGRVFVATIENTDSELSDGTNESGLYALNATTGEVEWRVNDTRSAPVVADGQVFTSHRPGEVNPADQPKYGNVTAHDAATGERVWASGVQGQVVAYADGRLFVSDEQSEAVAAVDATDGSLLWRTTVGEALFFERGDSLGETLHFEGGLVATDDAVYVTNDDPLSLSTDSSDDSSKRVTAFAADDGARMWTANITTEFGTTPRLLSAPAVANGTVYVTSDDDFDSGAGQEVGTVHALNTETGAEEWTFSTKADLHTAPSVANGTVSVGGVYEWNTDWELERDEAAPVRGFELPYVVAFGLDASDGNETWNLMTNILIDGLDSGPHASVTADGRLYLTVTRQGLPRTTEIAAFESQADRPPWFYRVLEDEPQAENLNPNAEVEVSPPPDEDGDYEANTTVTLDASASSDGDGEVVSYEWDLDGDGEFEKTGETVGATTAAEACEVVTVTLRVTDDEGATDETTVTLQTQPNE